MFFDCSFWFWHWYRTSWTNGPKVTGKLWPAMYEIQLEPAKEVTLQRARRMCIPRVNIFRPRWDCWAFKDPPRQIKIRSRQRSQWVQRCPKVRITSSLVHCLGKLGFAGSRKMNMICGARFEHLWFESWKRKDSDWSAACLRWQVTDTDTLSYAPHTHTEDFWHLHYTYIHPISPHPFCRPHLKDPLDRPMSHIAFLRSCECST